MLVYVDDKEHSATWSTNGNFSDITSRELFVGGASDVRLLNGSKATQNFIGCLREVSNIQPQNYETTILLCHI